MKFPLYTQEKPDSPEAPVGASQYADSHPTMADGGFRERLRKAQSAGKVHGVPGSVRHLVPGIQLTNPMNQGLGSVMRNTQRLFGITSRHCIDVQTEENLTKKELLARDLTQADVSKEGEKYQCNRPLGLSF